MKRLVIFLFLFMSVCGSSGCIVLPALEGYSKLGLSKSDREKLLPKALKDFHGALYWSDPMSASAFVKEEGRGETLEKLRKSVDGVRVVESKIESIIYDDDSEKADVRVNIRAYKVPYYVVEDHKYIEKWEFTLSDGWQYVSQTATK